MPTTADPAEAPDWSSLNLHLTCPRCRYNLHMLTVARCPECGLTFDWDQLIAAARQRVDSPLFEYRWNTRPVRSFFGTLYRTLNPWRLWRTARVEHFPRAGPLLAFALLVSGLAIIARIMFWCLAVLLQEFAMNSVWVGAWRFLERNFARLRVSATVFEGLIIDAAPLLAVALAMHVFRWTLVRHAVRWPHLLRIAVLAWTGMIGVRYIGQLAAIASCSIPRLLTAPGPAWFQAAEAGDLVLVGFRLAGVVFLVASVSLGYGYYLKLPRPWLAGLLTVILAYAILCGAVLVPLFYLSRTLDGEWLHHMNNWFPGARRAVLWTLTGHWP
jgi:hypothetical protein